MSTIRADDSLVNSSNVQLFNNINSNLDNVKTLNYSNIEYLTEKIDSWKLSKSLNSQFNEEGARLEVDYNNNNNNGMTDTRNNQNTITSNNNTKSTQILPLPSSLQHIGIDTISNSNQFIGKNIERDDDSKVCRSSTAIEDVNSSHDVPIVPASSWSIFNLISLVAVVLVVTSIISACFLYFSNIGCNIIIGIIEAISSMCGTLSLFYYAYGNPFSSLRTMYILWSGWLVLYTITMSLNAIGVGHTNNPQYNPAIYQSPQFVFSLFVGIWLWSSYGNRIDAPKPTLQKWLSLSNSLVNVVSVVAHFGIFGPNITLGCGTFVAGLSILNLLVFDYRKPIHEDYFYLAFWSALATYTGLALSVMKVTFISLPDIVEII